MKIVEVGEIVVIEFIDMSGVIKKFYIINIFAILVQRLRVVV